MLQDKFDWGDAAGEDGKMKLISYGPCQFPTLGLIVQRAWLVCLVTKTLCSTRIRVNAPALTATALGAS